MLPLLRRIHPPPTRTSCARSTTARRCHPALAELLASPAGSKRVDLGGGVQAVREYERLWLERSPVPLEGEVRWGPWRIASNAARP